MGLSRYFSQQTSPEDAQEMLEDAISNAHVMSPKAFSFRETLTSDEPQLVDEKFVQALQTILFNLEMATPMEQFFDSSLLCNREAISDAHKFQ